MRRRMLTLLAVYLGQMLCLRSSGRTILAFSNQNSFTAVRRASSRAGFLLHQLARMQADTQSDFLPPKRTKFGAFDIPDSQIFFSSKHSLGIVNLKPIVPGHVLIIPKQVKERLADLSSEEITDLYQAVHKIGPALERYYGAEALTVATQDGAAAGQTVPHVHVHILPRRPGDFPRNDQVYEELDRADLRGEGYDLDEARRPRAPEEMAAEAHALRALFHASAAAAAASGEGGGEGAAHAS